MSSVQELRAALSSSAPANKAAEEGPTKAQSGAFAMLLLAGVLGASVGIAFDRFVLPHDAVAPPKPAGVSLPQATPRGDVVATGTFIQPDRNNPLSRGSGGVSVRDGKVVLDADFAVTPGPDYRVLLVPKAAIRAAADVAKTMYVDLGPLTAYQGSQSFVVPAGVDVSRYPSVVIWCAPYAALISSADLSFGK